MAPFLAVDLAMLNMIKDKSNIVKRTLLVDTNRAAIPIYQALCEMQHEVWVVGGDPAETLAKLADNYVQLDYSDANRVASFIEEKKIDFLVPGCTDLSYQICAEINQSRFPGFDSPANALTLNSKNEFRRIATEQGVPVPRILSFSQAAEVESLIVKPVDSFSGRGITVLRKPTSEKLSDAFEVACNASKTGDALCEEFVEGGLFSHSAFIWDNEIVADFVVEEDCTTNPFTVDLSRIAVRFPNRLLDSLRRDICRLASSLRLVNGLMHTQFIVSGERYWLIEVTRRCPGDLYSLLIELSTGYPYAASYVAPFVGKKPSFVCVEEIPERIIRHTVSSKEGETLWGYRFTCPVDIRLFVPLATSGDFIDACPYGRAGIFFFRASSANEQKKLYKKIISGNLYSFTAESMKG